MPDDFETHDLTDRNWMETKTGRPQSTPAAPIDWKAIAQTLFQKVNFALTHLKAPPGSGVVFNQTTGVAQHWKDGFADALETVPGVVVDREMMHLNPKQQKQLAKKREQEATEKK